MKRTISLTTLIATLIVTLFATNVSAQDNVFAAPGADVSGDTLSVELDSHSSGWATLALPINGEVPISQITDDCDIQGGVAYGFEGQGTSSESINGMRGYAIELGSDCTAEIETSSIDGSLATSLPDNGWTVFSVPSEMSVSELESDCSFNGYEGTNIFEITLDEGNVPLESSDTLEGTGLYWIRVSGNDCGLDLSSQPFETPGDGQDGSDDSDDSDDSDQETTAESGDIYFWDTEASTSLVNNEAGSSGDGAVYSYDMYDGDIVGSFTSHGSGERTIIVDGPNGEDQRTASGNYVGFPGGDPGGTWGVNEDGVYGMDSGSTEYTVTVEDAETGEELDSATFTFNPNFGNDGSDDGSSGGDESPSDCAEDEYYDHGFDMCLEDSDDSSDDSSSDRSNEEIGDISFEIRPDPSEWTDGSNSRVSCEDRERRVRFDDNIQYQECEVDAEFEAEVGEGYIDGYRVEADINNQGFDNDPSPFGYVCEGPEWTTCFTSITNTVDTRDIDSYSAWIEVQEETCENAGRHQGERCTWETVEREEFSNFQ